MNYIVIKHFQDRLTKEYYGIGSTYQGDQQRIEELERGGFIAPAESAEAQNAMQQAQNNAQAQGNNLEKVDKAQTVLDGQMVDVKQAQQAIKQAESNQQTGIQAAHNNDTEPVEAGKKAKNTNTQATKAAKTAVRTKQSGQAEAGKAMNQSKTQQAAAHNETVNPDLAQAETTQQTKAAKGKGK